MIIHYDIIPIIFFPGCGGNMLLDLLKQAKLKSNESLPLSHNGNAHKADKEIRPVFFNIKNPQIFAPGKDPNRDLTDELISCIKDIRIVRPSRTPYFALYHLTHNEELNKYFYKSITISYEEDDFKTIIALYHKKLHVDDLHDEDYITDGPFFDEKIHVKKWQENKMLGIRDQQNGYDFQGERCLNIRFKELNELPVEPLFKKLSDFTKIPYENFNDSNILKWREINAKVIAEYEWFL